jgi:hypothetical protein
VESEKYATTCSSICFSALHFAFGRAPAHLTTFAKGSQNKKLIKRKDPEREETDVCKAASCSVAKLSVKFKLRSYLKRNDDVKELMRENLHYPRHQTALILTGKLKTTELILASVL